MNAEEVELRSNADRFDGQNGFTARHIAERAICFASVYPGIIQETSDFLKICYGDGTNSRSCETRMQLATYYAQMCALPSDRESSDLSFFL